MVNAVELVGVCPAAGSSSHHHYPCPTGPSCPGDPRCCHPSSPATRAGLRKEILFTLSSLATSGLAHASALARRPDISLPISRPPPRIIRHNRWPRLLQLLLLVAESSPDLQLTPGCMVTKSGAVGRWIWGAYTSTMHAGF